MKNVGIVTESWKVSIFTAHLDRHGFEYTQIDGPVKDCVTLKVRTPTVADLCPVVQAAICEARRGES